MNDFYYYLLAEHYYLDVVVVRICTLQENSPEKQKEVIENVRRSGRTERIDYKAINDVCFFFFETLDLFLIPH